MRKNTVFLIKYNNPWTGLLKLAVLIIVTILVSGCSIISLDSDDMLRPPKPTGACADIQKIITDKYGDSVSLIYPNRGTYRSAVTMADLGGNGKDLAVVLFEEGEPKKIHVMIAKEIAGEWVSVGDFKNDASGIDKICFEDLDKDGKKEVIASFKAPGTSFNKVSAYIFKDDEYKEIVFKEKCSDFIVYDFDEDEKKEILLLSVKSGTSIASGKLFKVDYDKMTDNLLGVVQLDSRVTGYSQVLTGKINTYQDGIVVDGNVGPDAMLTEIIYWDKIKGKLISAMYNLRSNADNFSLRDNKTASMDINGDGIIEIPSILPFPGYWDNKSGLLCFSTAWNVFDTRNNTYKAIENMFINYIDGYYFKIPDKWLGKVTAKMETTSKTLTFSKWVETRFGTKASGVAVLKIQVFSLDDWKAISNKSDFILLETTADNVYVATIISRDGALALDASEVKERFKLINF